MIFKLHFPEDRFQWAQAKDMLHLLKSYDAEYIDFQEIQEVTEISEEEAQNIMLVDKDEEGEPMFPLINIVDGDDFCILGGSDWL